MSYFSQNKIRLAEFNVENLFLRLDHYRGETLKDLSEAQWQKLSASTVPNKPLRQVLELAQAIDDFNPDILMLVEVGGVESLLNFNRHFLGDRYTAHLLEGNSNRGIDLGYLVKRGLPFTCELNSHKERELDFLYPHERQSKVSGYGHLRSARIKSHRFSRDVLELRLYESDQSEPVFISLLVHLKSPLDRSRIDPGGRDRRQAELEKLVQIYSEIRQNHPQTPVILAGDFNGGAGQPGTDPEFAALYLETKLRDALDVAGVAQHDRFTHQQIYKHRPALHRQIDFIFLSPELFARVENAETRVYRYCGEDKLMLPIPLTLNEKRLLPSDHYPVVVTLNPDSNLS